MRRPYRRSIRLAFMALVVGAVVLPVAPAQAGLYTIRACNVPAQAPSGSAPWVWEHLPSGSAFDDCAVGGGFGLWISQGSALPADDYYAVLLRSPDPAISIRQVHLWLTARLEATGSSLFVSGGAQDSGLSIAGPASTAGAIEWLSPLYAPTNGFFNLTLYCSTNASTGCTPLSRAPVEVHGSEVTLSESRAPAIAATGGTVLNAQAGTTAPTISFVATDGESGIARVEAVLGGKVIASADLTHTAHCRYDTWNACDLRIAETLTLDTSALAAGTYEPQLRVEDAAGNRTTLQLTTPVTVDGRRGTNTPASGDEAIGAPLLSAVFRSNHRRRMIANWRSNVIVSGHLLQPSGAPIGGATLDVRIRVLARGGRWRLVQALATDERGTFSLTVHGKLASRRIRISYRASPSSRSVARDLTLLVRPRISLRVALRGVVVTYSGRLDSGPVPRSGKTVRMQGRAVGGAWQTFAIRRAARDGRFSGRYRLRVRRPGVRLQFRALVPTARDYPFTAGHSRVITRRVR